MRFCQVCGQRLVGLPCYCKTAKAQVPDPETRLALLEGEARDQSAVIDEMRCQLIDMQRRLQGYWDHVALLETRIVCVSSDVDAQEKRIAALEDQEAMIQRGVEAFCGSEFTGDDTPDAPVPPAVTNWPGMGL